MTRQDFDNLLKIGEHIGEEFRAVIRRVGPDKGGHWEVIGQA